MARLWPLSFFLACSLSKDFTKLLRFLPILSFRYEDIFCRRIKGIKWDFHRLLNFTSFLLSKLDLILTALRKQMQNAFAFQCFT